MNPPHDHNDHMRMGDARMDDNRHPEHPDWRVSIPDKGRHRRSQSHPAGWPWSQTLSVCIVLRQLPKV